MGLVVQHGGLHQSGPAPADAAGWRPQHRPGRTLRGLQPARLTRIAAEYRYPADRSIPVGPLDSPGPGASPSRPASSTQPASSSLR
jgi:hypothetical protein